MTRVRAEAQSRRREDVLEELQRFEEEFGEERTRPLCNTIIRMTHEAASRLRLLDAQEAAQKDAACPVCVHPEASSVNRALTLGGQSPRSASRRYSNLSRRQLEEHKRRCLGKDPAVQ